ncbi:MAG TPA: GFA family protein [Gammaproteobacteria bacterium]
MARTFTGGCLCGAVRYTVSADPIFAGKCYCEDCRKTTGTGHGSVFAVPSSAVQLTGKLTEYTKPGGSGQPMTRGFCPTCGSRITGVAAAMPGVTLLMAGSLDDPEQFTSQMSIFCSRAPSWDRPPAETPTFPEMPPS